MNEAEREYEQTTVQDSGQIFDTTVFAGTDAYYSASKDCHHDRTYGGQH